jgi:hypothetical protein
MPKDQLRKGPESTDDQTFAVHVRQARSGSWWTVDVHGEVLSQWPSEFAAIDAGRVNARRFALPLVIHDGYGSRTERLAEEE